MNAALADTLEALASFDVCQLNLWDSLVEPEGLTWKWCARDRVLRAGQWARDRQQKQRWRASHCWQRATGPWGWGWSQARDRRWWGHAGYAVELRGVRVADREKDLEKVARCIHGLYIKCSCTARLSSDHLRIQSSRSASPRRLARATCTSPYSIKTARYSTLPGMLCILQILKCLLKRILQKKV